MPTIHVILGPPRSGLNLLSNCLRILGITLPDHQPDANTINKLLLQDLGLSPFTLVLPPDWLQSAAAAKAKARIHNLLASISVSTHPPINDSSLTNNLNNHRPSDNNTRVSSQLTIKYSLLAEIWFQAFQEANIQPTFIFTVRHPWEVAQFLAVTENLDMTQAHILWLSHTRAVLRALENQPSAPTTDKQTTINTVTSFGSSQSAPDNRKLITKNYFITFDQLLADPITTLHRILHSQTPDLRLTDNREPITDNNSQSASYRALLDLVHPSLKHHHASALSNRDKQTFDVFAIIYHQMRNSQYKDALTRKSLVPDQLASTMESDLTNTFLSVIGNYEKQAGVTKAEQETRTRLSDSPLYARIMFPSPGNNGSSDKVFSLLEGQWQRITLSGFEPQRLKDEPIIISPLNTNGIVKISHLNLMNKATGAPLWTVKTIEDFKQLIVQGTAVRLPDKDGLTLLITGRRSQIYLPRLSLTDSGPVKLEVWLKAETDQGIVHDSIFHSLIANEQEAILRETETALNLPEGFKIPADEEAIVDYLLKNESTLSVQERFDLYCALGRHHIAEKNIMRALHYLGQARKAVGDDPRYLLSLAPLFLAINQIHAALDLYVTIFLKKGFLDEKLTPKMIQAYKQIQTRAKINQEHGQQILMDYIKENIEYFKSLTNRELTLIEIGSTREEVPGQGSTAKLAGFCRTHELHFISVDMDPQNTNMAMHTLSKVDAKFQAFNQKGEDFLRDYAGPMDFVFLDAYDFDHGGHREDRQGRYEKYLGARISNEACHQMHLDCAKEVKEKLSPFGAVCFDDTWFKDGAWQAKGTRGVPYLLENGFWVVLSANRSAVLTRLGRPLQIRTKKTGFTNASKARSHHEARLSNLTFPLIICAHHKTGAAYTVRTFKNIAKAFNRKIWLKFYDPDPKTQDWDLCIHQHSRVRDIIHAQNFRGWHCIRHPKALIYSATLYHQKCDEPWVDIPLRAFTSHTFWSASDGYLYNKIKNQEVSLKEKEVIMNADYSDQVPASFVFYDAGYNMQGKTYREFITGLTTIEEKVLFEMRAYSQGVIRDMLNFPMDARFYQITLESISRDTSMSDLRNAFQHLGFFGEDLKRCLEIASENCLWKIGSEGIGKHATTGMSEDWKDVFTGEVETEYRRLFGWAEEALGYQEDGYASFVQG